MVWCRPTRTNIPSILGIYQTVDYVEYQEPAHPIVQANHYYNDEDALSAFSTLEELMLQGIPPDPDLGND